MLEQPHETLDSALNHVAALERDGYYVVFIDEHNTVYYTWEQES